MQTTLQRSRSAPLDAQASADVALPTGRWPRPAASWQPWAASGRPATAVEERRFVDRLVDLAGSPAEHDRAESDSGHTRRDVTAIVNALRCGLDADELLRRAPGLVPGKLVAAHRAVEERRRGAARAWQAIAADPSLSALEAHGHEAATLLPVVIARLQDRAASGVIELANAIRLTAVEVDRVGRVARSVEDWMVAAPRHDAPRVGRLLYDLDEPALWDHEHFVPTRVGSIVPTRLAALLGERSAVFGRR